MLYLRPTGEWLPQSVFILEDPVGDHLDEEPMGSISSLNSCTMWWITGAPMVRCSGRMAVRASK